MPLNHAEENDKKNCGSKENRKGRMNEEIKQLIKRKDVINIIEA